MKVVFPDRFSIKKISNFTKFRPVGAEFFDADGQTEVKKLILALRNFTNAANKTGRSFKLPKMRIGS
jgi:hypothetical protein